MRYFTSDQHFFDSDIIVYSDRPYETPEMMNDDLVRRFNEATQDAEAVYIVGDIFGSCQPHFPYVACESIMKRIGIDERPFHLILGNHDTLRPEQYFEIGFQTVKRLDFIELDGVQVMLTHDPCMIQPRDTVAICGHIHTLFAENWQPLRNTFTINVSVEMRDYRPISELDILDLLNRSDYCRK